MPSSPLVSIAARRFAAAALDYALAAAWGGLLLFGVWIFADPPVSLVPPMGQRIGFATLTMPVTLALAYLETHGGSPGKRLMGFDLRASSGTRPGYGPSLARTSGKIGLPWELAHTAVWRIDDGVIDASTAGLIAAAYLLPLGAAIAVLGGQRAWYDLIAGTTVRQVVREETR